MGGGRVDRERACNPNDIRNRIFWKELFRALLLCLRGTLKSPGELEKKKNLCPSPITGQLNQHL